MWFLDTENTEHIVYCAQTFLQLELQTKDKQWS